MEKEVMEEEEEARAGRLLRHPLSCLAGTGSKSLISRKEPDVFPAAPQLVQKYPKPLNYTCFTRRILCSLEKMDFVNSVESSTHSLWS